MNETCRRTAWPSEAADCSAARSGSARRTATSVMAEDISFSSWARQASSARNQNSAIGRQMVAAATTIIGLVRSEPPAGPLDASMAQASRAPTASQPPDAAAAIRNGRFDGFCCSAKISPPIEGASSLAATWARAGPAARRLAARRPPCARHSPPVGAGAAAGLAAGLESAEAAGATGGGASAVRAKAAAGTLSVRGPGGAGGSAASRCVFPS